MGFDAYDVLPSDIVRTVVELIHVDYLALSHPDRDHYGGFVFVARNFTPSEFWTGGTSSPYEAYVAMAAAVKAAGARMRRCDARSAPMTIGGVSVRCVGPLANMDEVKDNNASMVIRLVFGHTSFLFPGDLEAKGERELMASGADLRATILKVPHHGSRTSSSAPFIEAVHPGVAVVSLGYLNRFHFPAPEVIGRYRDEGVRVLRTDEVGAVSAEVGAEEVRLRSFSGGEVAVGR